MSTPQQNLKKLYNKKICILGLGIENYALVRFLLDKKVECDITICDARSKRQCRWLHSSRRSGTVEPKCGKVSNMAPRPFGTMEPSVNDIVIKWRLGKNYDKNLDQFDIIFRVAGYPLFSPEIKKAGKAGVEISSPTKLFFELCPSKNIIGVTGTKGKGTTASLICHILKRAGRRVWIGGNIGIPMFSFIDKIKKNHWVVLELSSFQLEDMTVSPRIAVITNFSKEHLAPADPNNPNYHKTMRDYWNAKLNIIKWQKKGDKLVLNRNLKARFLNLAFKGKKISFAKSDLPSKLIGEHNKENIAAAVAVAKLVGMKNEIIKKAVVSFKGLEHRLEFVKNVNNVKYYNDSFATTPEATITALKSFDQPIILLAGGAEKKSNFKKLAKEIKKRVKFVVLLNGKATARFKRELLSAGFDKMKMKLVYNIKDAVKTANQNTEKDDIVLFSTACASFGMFKNYKERGEKFKREVERL